MIHSIAKTFHPPPIYFRVSLLGYTLQELLFMPQSNRGPRLGNGLDNNIVEGKWFGLVTTADSKIFILTAGSGNLTWSLQTMV